MIKYSFYIIALLVLLILQNGLVAQLGLGEIGNLILIFVVLGVTMLRVRVGLVLALVAGFMLDLASGSRDGTMIICMVAVFGASYFYMYKLVPREPNLPILVSCVLVNTVVFAVTFVLVNHLFALVRLDIAFDWQYVLGEKLLLDLLANLVFTYPIYLFFVFGQKAEERLEYLLVKTQ